MKIKRVEIERNEAIRLREKNCQPDYKKFKPQICLYKRKKTTRYELNIFELFLCHF